MFGLKKFFQKILDALYPDDCNCIVCDSEIPRGSRYVLCDECREKLPYNKGRICLRCGKVMENQAKFCLECQNHHKDFDIARSSLIYENEVIKLVHGLKFHNKKWLSKYMARFMVDTYNENALDADLIVPVPISNERFRERGYNQSMLLASFIAKEIDIKVYENIIVKTKNNLRQSELSSKERRENVKGCYKVIDKSKIKDKKVLVVDDLLTTGSTASEIAKKLKSAGAKCVYVLAFSSPREKVYTEKYDDFEEISYSDIANINMVD